MNFYEEVGGEETFRKLVHLFYQRMRTDDLIGPMYPTHDWEGAEDRLRWFLAQYWGGPHTFSENRGHPRLRMRHHLFAIGEKEAHRWLEIMDAAIEEIDEQTLAPAYRMAMKEHMRKVAFMLINQPESPAQ
ncbi:globin domain-containing protein [Corynebacterium kutscheri]|uniref:Hemoglobin-like protein n=1 Tax=Corynebacterium kutscheri TaxID=35755 RepID=A0AB38VSN7_9CORY|nr:globin [Corynebacterium kutscheri]VEH06643.1 hemoglobin-like protein [Corynebacterium kutscheri]